MKMSVNLKKVVCLALAVSFAIPFATAENKESGKDPDNTSAESEKKEDSDFKKNMKSLKSSFHELGRSLNDVSIKVNDKINEGLSDDSSSSESDGKDSGTEKKEAKK